MKKSKTIIAILLSLSMVFSMAGCGSKSGTDETSVTIEKPKSNADKMKRFDPEITLTFNKTEWVTNYPEGQDAQSNVMYDMWEEVIGVKVINSILCPASTMTEKMQLAIGSNEIPDFGIVDATMMDTLIKNDMVEDLTDVYNEWATDNLKETVGQSNNALFAPVTRDGRYMGIPLYNSLSGSYPVMWMRSDWLNKLGLEVPKTMEEALDIAMKFATEDPDGNGQKDTYGLYLDKDLGGLDFIMSAYEVYSGDNYWVKNEDGTFMAGCTDAKAKVPLKKLAELYEAGAIDPEFAVKDTAKEEELIAAGKLGIYIGYFFSPLGVMKDCVKNIEGADWVAVKMPPAEGIESYRPGIALNVNGYLYAKKGLEHPEALIVMMNHLCDGYAAPYLAKEPTDFYKKYNELAQIDEVRDAGANNLMPFQMEYNTNWGDKFVEAIENGDEHVEGKDADYQNVISTTLPEETSWSWKKVYLEGYLALDFENVRYSDYTGAPTDTAVKTQSLLTKQKLTDYIAIIMGEQPIDYFDQFAETYNNIGGSKIAEEIKAAVK
ncbi:hypothetical protein [Eisenbergiella sp.]